MGYANLLDDIDLPEEEFPEAFVRESMRLFLVLEKEHNARLKAVDEADPDYAKKIQAAIGQLIETAHNLGFPMLHFTLVHRSHKGKWPETKEWIHVIETIELFADGSQDGDNLD